MMIDVMIQHLLEVRFYRNLVVATTSNKRAPANKRAPPTILYPGNIRVRNSLAEIIGFDNLSAISYGGAKGERRR